MNGISSTGRPAAKNTEGQPQVSISPLPRIGATMPPPA